MKKLILAILIALLLLTSCSDYNIYKEEINICRVGNIYFDTLQAAVNHIASSRAISEDRTVYLLKDVLRGEYDDSIRKGVTVPTSFTGDLRIDFQGHRYDFSSKEQYFFRFLGGNNIEVVNGSSVIFADSISTESALIVGTRTVTIDEHLITDLRGTKKAVNVTKDGTLVIKANDNAKAGFSGTITISEGGSINLKGGTFTIIDILETGNADIKIYSGEFTFPHTIENRINNAISAVPEEEKGVVKTTTTHGPTFILHEAVPATCYNVGYLEYYECSSCHKLFKDIGMTQETTLEELTIPKLSHNIVYHEAKAQTCTESGNKEYWQCSNCGHYFSDGNAENEIQWSDIEIPSYGGHDLGEWKITISATCTTDGVKRRDCSRCDYFETDIIPATGHTSNNHIYGENDPNQHWYHCDIDNVDFGFENHTYGEWGPTSKPGMSQQRECIKCHHIEYSALGHEWVKVDEKAPTCTQDGNISYYYCVNHANEFTVDDNHTVYKTEDEIKISNLGHNVTYHTAKEPTCTENGNIEHWYCATEGKYFRNAECTIQISESEAILPALGHVPSSSWVTTDATYHWRVCTRENCDEKLDIEAHFYEITYDFDASERNLTMTSVCKCGRNLSSNTTSDTGAFDLSTVAGDISVERLSANSWKISADETKVKYCYWSGENGVTLLTGPEPFSISCEIQGSGKYKIFCHVKDRFGNEIDIYFVELTKYR